MALFSHPLVEGMLLSFGLIVSIGMQNTYVLKQGILRQRVFLVATICVACDILLIALGALGCGSIISGYPTLQRIMVWVGVAFLAVYGVKSLWGAIKGGTFANIDESQSISSLRSVILASLGFSLLNPQAIIDATMLIGGMAGAYATNTERLYFALGASLCSILWFYSLAFGARLLRPFFTRPLTARLFDLFVAAVMFRMVFVLLR